MDACVHVECGLDSLTLLGGTRVGKFIAQQVTDLVTRGRLVKLGHLSCQRRRAPSCEQKAGVGQRRVRRRVRRRGPMERL